MYGMNSRYYRCPLIVVVNYWSVHWWHYVFSNQEEHFLTSFHFASSFSTEAIFMFTSRGDISNSYPSWKGLHSGLYAKITQLEMVIMRYIFKGGAQRMSLSEKNNWRCPAWNDFFNQSEISIGSSLCRKIDIRSPKFCAIVTIPCSAFKWKSKSQKLKIKMEMSWTRYGYYKRFCF